MFLLRSLRTLSGSLCRAVWPSRCSTIFNSSKCPQQNKVSVVVYGCYLHVSVVPHGQKIYEFQPKRTDPDLPFILVIKAIVQQFWILAHCHDPSSHISRFVTFNCRSKLLLDRRSRVPSGSATLRRLMEFLGFHHQTQQIHDQKTPKRCGGQAVTCTFTTLWDNNRMLPDRVVLEVKSDFTLQTRLLGGVISKAHVYCRYFRQQHLWRSEVWSWQTLWWTMRTTF